MKRSKLLGLAFMVMLAITAITATTALATATLPSLLPEGEATHPLEAKTESGKSVFGSPGITGVESSASTGETSGTLSTLGTFHIHFTGTKQALLGACTGTGESSGVVLSLGEYHVRWYPHLGIVVIIFLVNPTHFSCGTTEVSVEGCVAGSITPEGKETTLLEEVLATASGNNTIITVLNNEHTGEEACQLLAKVGAGATELSAEQTTQLVSKFEKEGKAVEVEVMPL
jgi:hypothetical protein